MRILRVADIPDNRTGGMSRVMHLSGDAIRCLGHDVEFAFTPVLGSTRRVETRRFIIPARVPSLVRQLSRDRRRYDVVELHEPLAAFYCLARMVDSRLPPAVVLSHGLESRAAAAASKYRRAKNLVVPFRRRVLPYSVIWQAELGLRRADHIACLNTEDEAALLSKGIPAARITRVRSGVAKAFLDAGRNPSDPNRRGQILFVGTWLDRKGIRDLVPAVTETLARAPGTRFTVAGCGVEPAVVRSAFPGQLLNRIDVIRQVESDEALIQLYRRHQVLVLPSYFEGQPLVMIEAAAMKLAIVSTGICGMKDFIRDGENGLLVPVADPQALATCLYSVVSDEQLAGRLGDKAHCSALSQTWDDIARDYLTAYQAAIGFRHQT